MPAPVVNAPAQPQEFSASPAQAASQPIQPTPPQGAIGENLGAKD
jgi:general secretion pathway protein C